MGSLVEINSYEIRDSENRQYKIPVVNGVSLHSMHDPKDEASLLIKRHIRELMLKKNVLVMGLGMGFHVQEIIKIFNDIKKTDYQIVVVEPNLKMIEDCHTFNQINNNNLLVFYDQDIDNLFANAALADFILQSPKVIVHPGSYSVYKKYFRKFLTYGAINSINAMASRIVNEKFRRHLNNIPTGMNIDKYCKVILQDKGKKYLEDDDFLLMAYNKIK